MINYITQKKAQEIDENLIKIGHSIDSLIEIAGLLAFDVLKDILPEEAKKFIVVCGPGNNGSDGLVIARYLQMNDKEVTVYFNKIKHNNLKQIAENVGVSFTSSKPNFKDFDCVIDAVFGFSFREPLRKPYDEMISHFSAHPLIISIDVPSGSIVDDSNAIHKFKVSHLISFVAPKLCAKTCESVYITRCFVPKSIYNDKNNYFNYEKF